MRSSVWQTILHKITAQIAEQKLCRKAEIAK